jgi:class 3 adenylate cyclase
LHTGEVEREQAVIRGINVVVAARIGSLADAGQIFVSSTVRELVAGSGLTFVDRGAHVLKGVPDAREIYEVEATPPR